MVRHWYGYLEFVGSDMALFMVPGALLVQGPILGLMVFDQNALLSDSF